LDIIDVKRAAKVSGSRFAYLKNDGVLLEFAIVQFALETLIKECAQDSGKTCETGENICSLAKQVLIEAIEASWQFSPESPETGYQMNVKLSDSENSFFFEAGGVTNPPLRASEKLISTPSGQIVIKLEIYSQRL